MTRTTAGDAAAEESSAAKFKKGDIVKVAKTEARARVTLVHDDGFYDIELVDGNDAPLRTANGEQTLWTPRVAAEDLAAI